jgi:hypothetical protein
VLLQWRVCDAEFGNVKASTGKIQHNIRNHLTQAPPQATNDKDKNFHPVFIKHAMLIHYVA